MIIFLESGNESEGTHKDDVCIDCFFLNIFDLRNSKFLDAGYETCGKVTKWKGRVYIFNN